MAGFVQGADREQVTLFPARLDEYVAQENPVRVVDAVVEGLDLDSLGFIHVQPLDIGRPGYHPRMIQALHLRLLQPRAVEPAAGARVPAQHRSDVADRAARTRLQDHRRLPKGQQRGHS